MSVAAIKLAYQQELPGKSSVKFILVTLAHLHHHEDENWEVFAAVDYLVKATSLNRKTVMKGLETLREMGYLMPTGKLTGRNGCIPIYRLSFKSQAPRPAYRDNGGNTFFHQEEDQQRTGKAASRPPAEQAGVAPQPIAKGWSLPDEWRAWTKTQKAHWDDSKIDTVATIFHIHWSSIVGPKGMKPNWFAEWRKWVLRENDSAPGQATTPAAPGYTYDLDNTDVAAIGADIRAAMAELSQPKNPG